MGYTLNYAKEVGGGPTAHIDLFFLLSSVTVLFVIQLVPKIAYRPQGQCTVWSRSSCVRRFLALKLTINVTKLNILFSIFLLKVRVEVLIF